MLSAIENFIIKQICESLALIKPQIRRLYFVKIYWEIFSVNLSFISTLNLPG